jgi:hypothetical protein
MRCLVIPVLVLTACGGNPTWTSNEGDCLDEEVLEAAPDLDYEEIALSEEDQAVVPELIALAEVIDSQEALDAFNDYWDLHLEAVDFASEQILAAAAAEYSVCGDLELTMRVVEVDGAPHLLLHLLDPEGLCGDPCEGTVVAFVAVKVRAGEGATVCAQSARNCEA